VADTITVVLPKPMIIHVDVGAHGKRLFYLPGIPCLNPLLHIGLHVRQRAGNEKEDRKHDRQKQPYFYL